MEKLQKGEEVDIDLGDPEVQAAATKIQASFRGHKAREDVKKQKDEEAAAVKIQAGFRGHKAREKVKDIKISLSQEAVSENVEAAEADMLGKDSDVQAEEAVPEEVGGAEESEKREAAPDVQPYDAVEPEVEAEPKEPEVAESTDVPEPAAEDQGSQEAEKETVDVAGEGEAGDGQVKEVGEEEAAGESEDAAGKGAEAAEEVGDGVDDAQPDGAEGGAVEGETEQIDLDLNDPDLNNAAIKIQASFRGHKAREEVKDIKSSESLPQADNEVASEEKVDDDQAYVSEGGEHKGNNVEESAAEGADGEPSVAEGTEDSKPSED